MKRILLAPLLIFVLTACQEEKPLKNLSEKELKEQVKSIKSEEVKKNIKSIKKNELEKIDECIAIQKSNNLPIDKCLNSSKK